MSQSQSKQKGKSVKKYQTADDITDDLEQNPADAQRITLRAQDELSSVAVIKAYEDVAHDYVDGAISDATYRTIVAQTSDIPNTSALLQGKVNEYKIDNLTG